jgi:hypothetical protein
LSVTAGSDIGVIAIWEAGRRMRERNDTTAAPSILI